MKAKLQRDIEKQKEDKKKLGNLEQGKIVGCNLELRAHRVDEGHCTAYEVQDFLSQYNLTTSTPISTQGHKDYVFTKK